MKTTMKSTLPPSVTFQFENALSTVIWDAEKRRLYVQSLDAYAFQRELIVQPSGDGFEIHAYQHPARREISTASVRHAYAFFSRFLGLCEKYPVLLFRESAPRCEGFVRVHEMLFRGAALSDVTLNL